MNCCTKSQTRQIFTWMSEALDQFVNSISLNRNESTISGYRYDVGRFLEYLHERGVRRAGSVNSQHIEDYLGWCKSDGKSDASVNRYYMAIRAFCKFMHKRGTFDAGIADDVSTPKSVARAPKIPSGVEVVMILDQPDLGTESGLRDRAMLELLYSSGLRASELCDLELDDLCGKTSSVRVMCGKRDKTRTVPITDDAFMFIQEYVQKYRGHEQGYLFITMKGKRIRRQLLREIVTDYARKAGVNHVTTHTMRHACATHLLNEGASLVMIKDVLGHASIASTQKYTHLSSEMMQSMFREFHPKQKQVVNAKT